MTRSLTAGLITAFRLGCGLILASPALPTVAAAQGFHRSRVGDFEIIALHLFDPDMKAGKFSSFSSDTTLIAGIRSLATNGHSSGHTSYVVESRGQTLVVLGDLVHMGAMQFPEPSLTSGFDSDQRAAAEQRIRILRLAAEREFLIAGAHLAFPGIGRVKAAGQGFHWTPVDSAR